MNRLDILNLIKKLMGDDPTVVSAEFKIPRIINFFGLKFKLGTKLGVTLLSFDNTVPDVEPGYLAIFKGFSPVGYGIKFNTMGVLTDVYAFAKGAAQPVDHKLLDYFHEYTVKKFRSIIEYTNHNECTVKVTRL